MEQIVHPSARQPAVVRRKTILFPNSDEAVRPARLGLDLRDWPGRQLLRHPLAEADEGHPDLQTNRQPTSRTVPAGPPKDREHGPLSRNRSRRRTRYRRASGRLKYLGRADTLCPPPNGMFGPCSAVGASHARVPLECREADVKFF